MKSEILKCRFCGAVVETLVPCDCPCGIQCCGEKMSAVTTHSTDGAGEKHLPVAQEWEGGTLVKVGTVSHPMTAEHQILWIEMESAGHRCRKYLNPGDVPEAFFPCKLAPGTILREYCNIHGLWENVIQPPPKTA